MLTERFYKIRKDELDKIFSKKNIASVWRKIVKDQLRNADIKDIFDYYDFNYNIDVRALLLRNDLLNGNYQCSLPLIYRVEKKFGICRHLIIPQPLDALILQVITEELRKEIIDKQPSKNAFYSQDRHNVSKPHEIDEYGYTWRELWKQMQKEIYKFSTEKELIIVSDLSNYYDSIDISELRKKITGFVNDKEVLIDILFKIIEKVSWLPDYLPYTARGLPTTNIEGVRLLAHLYLFELDSILMEKSNDSFTRWMDDLVIGVNSRDEAVEILSSASDILKSRGLALNLAKTDVFDSKQAEYHFLILENKYLDSLKLNKLGRKEKIIKASEINKRFNKHLKTNLQAKYSEKITKRYITAFGKLNSELLLKKIPMLYEQFPGIRQNILLYLNFIGFKSSTAKTVLEILNQLKLYDDISLFNVCKLVTDWNISLDKTGDTFLKHFNDKIFSFSEKRKTPFDFYCLLWVKAKYDHPETLYQFITKYENIWKATPFLRRYVTAIMARLLPFKEEKVKLFLEKQISTSEPQVVSIANHILNFSTLGYAEAKIKMYLFSSSKKTNYSLSKYLVLCSFLNSERCRSDEDVISKTISCVNDFYYRKWIEQQYNIK